MPVFVSNFPYPPQTLLLGTILGSLAFLLLTKVFDFGKKFIPKHKWIVTLFWYVIVPLLITTLCIFFAPVAYYIRTVPCAITYHHLTIEPKDSQLSKFYVQEFIVLEPKLLEKLKASNLIPYSAWESIQDDQKGIQLPEIEVTSNNYGFLLKEVKFEPSSIYDLHLPFLDPYFLTDYNGSPVCGKTTVELRDFPLNSFYAAREADELKRYPYIDTETITWSSWSLADRDIRFAYIPPPFLPFRPLVTPFLGASSLSQWVIGLIGALGAVIFTPIVKPVFIEMLQKRFKKKLDLDDVVTPMKETTKIIVSSKGDEKEIERKKENNSRN